MALPIDLVLIRHGQSEANEANRLSQAGDHSAYTPEFKNRHSASFRLTKLGRKQAALAGQWIYDEFFNKSIIFDRYITSEYIRAIETAGCLRLPGAEWFFDFYLTERDWGEMEVLSQHGRPRR